MARREKLRRKLRSNPTGAKMRDIETLLTRFDFVLDRVSGSHHLFVYREGTVYRSPAWTQGEESICAESTRIVR